MKNLIKAVTNEQKTHLEEFIATINKAQTPKDLEGWQYNDLLPKGKKLTDMTTKNMIGYLITRKEKKIYKSIESEVNHIKSVFESGELISAKISVEWKKSKMWGSNPTAEAWVQFKNKGGQMDSNYTKTGSIGGCGYDKLSTAVAQALNQFNEVLKPLYIKKDKNITKNNHDLLGYGSGYGILPSLEGGVGVSCYPAIFAKIGYKFETVASGKTYDVFTITKINK